MERKIKLEISEDKMQAHLTIPAEDKYFAMQVMDIHKILQSSGVVFGAIDEEIERIITNKSFNRRILVAKGQMPERGKDASITYRFDAQKDFAQFMEAKHEDLLLSKINYIQQVLEGQEVAVKSPATTGREGTTVTGQTLPTEPGEDKTFFGEGVRISPDGLRMLADRNGQVLLENDQIRVVPLLVVDKDLDRSTGNISFEGSVLIRGSVPSDFSVKAALDVEINGNVGKAQIEAGGHLFVKGGIQGKGEAQMTAGKNIATKFIENANITSGESVYINGHVMNCIVEARLAVIADGKRAHIVGGHIMAFDRVQADSLGSRDNVTTKIDMAAPQLQKKWEDDQKKVLEPQIMAAYDMLKKLKDAIAKLADKKEQQGGMLLPKEQSFLDRLEAERTKNQEELEKRLAGLESIKKGLDVFRKEIRILGPIYVGVSIQIGEAKEDIRQPLQSIRFTRYGDHINPERI